MKRLSKILGLCFALILSISLVHAIEPSQQFNKILLNPFYRQSMDAQAYDYNITIDPPDGFEEVVSAIITYQMWLNPTVEFFLSVNGQTCNTPSYEVHTSYAGAGEGTIFFDCTNIINHAGQYNITLTPDDDTGAVTGWLDITYQNNQSDYIETVGNVDTVGNVAEVGKLTEPEMDIHGTEYTSGQNAKVFLQLLDGDNQPIENSSCYTSIYYPTNQVWKYQQLMTYVNEGIFAYDFTTPQVQGVYPVSAFCTLPTYEQNSTEVYDTFEGDDGWAGAWDYDGCSVQSTYSYSSPSALECINDKFPERDITSSDAYARVDYSFWYRATGFSSSAYIFYQLIDASGTVYYLEVVTDGQDDGTWRRVTGSLSSDTDGFDFDGTITFKIDTNNDLDGNDYYYLDSLELSFAEEIAVNGTEYQIVRGSSEVHVTSDVEYEPVISYGTLTNETFDGYFYLYYDVYSGTNQNKTGQKVQLPIFNAFPCEEVQDVFLKNESGEWENISYSKRLLGNRNDRCSVNVEMDLAVAESYEIMIKLTNFWRLELLGRFDEATINKNIINDGCVYYQMANGLDNFTVPLMSAPSETDDFWLSCQYYFQTYYDLNKTIVEKFVLQVGEANYTEEQMGELEGIYLNLLQQADLLNDLMKGILNNWQQGNDYSQTIIGGGSDIEYLTFFANISGNQMNYNAMQNLPAIVVGDMWEAENRTLTASRSLWVGGTEYSPDEEVGKVVVRLVDGTDSPVDDANCTIRIFYPDNTPYIYDAQMTNYVPPGNETGAGGIYLFDFNLSSIPGVYPYGIDCHITSGPSPKHYYILDTFHVFGSNRTKTAEAVWEYGTRTLTNATNIAPDIWGGNYTVSPSILGQLAASTWDYVARYVHGEII